MSRVFCCCVVMIFLLQKSLGTRRLGARLDSPAYSLAEDEHGGIDAYPMKWGARSAWEGRTQSFCKVRQCLPAKRLLSEMSQKRPCKSPGKLTHPVKMNLLSARRLWGR